MPCLGPTRYALSERIEHTPEYQSTESRTVIETVAPNVDHSQHGNGYFLPCRRDAREEPVDLCVVGSVEDEFVWVYEVLMAT
jgi:hypothetical protein